MHRCTHCAAPPVLHIRAVGHLPLRSPRRPACRSYESADLWPLLASPADGVRLSFVKAERSTFRWGGKDEEQIRQVCGSGQLWLVYKCSPECGLRKAVDNCGATVAMRTDARIRLCTWCCHTPTCSWAIRFTRFKGRDTGCTRTTLVSEVSAQHVRQGAPALGCHARRPVLHTSSLYVPYVSRHSLSDRADGLFDILAPSFGGTPDLRMQRSPSRSHAVEAVASNIRIFPATARQLQAMLE